MYVTQYDSVKSYMWGDKVEVLCGATPARWDQPWARDVLSARDMLNKEI